MQPNDSWLQRGLLADELRGHLGKVAFVSINPDLRNDFGHYRPYERQLQHQVEQLGGQYYCLMSLDAPNHWGGRYIRTFSTDSGLYALMNAAGRADPARAAKLFCDEFQKGIDQIRRNDPSITKVVAFFYCGSARLAAMLASQDLDSGVAITINGFWDFLDPDIAGTVKRLSACKFSRHIAFLPCSFKETDLLQGLSGLRFPWIPHPAPGLSDDAVLEMLAEPGFSKPADWKPTLFFPTLPTVGKGSEFVDEFLEQVHEQFLSGFHVIVRDVEGRRESKCRERFGSGVSIEYMNKAVSDEVMVSAYRRADIILIPYGADVFGFRTSGILVDAFVYGAVPIVLADTWLAAVCERLSAGVVLGSLSVDLVVQELKTVASQLTTMRRASKRAAYHYCAENNWVSLLFAIVDAHRTFVATELEDTKMVDTGQLVRRGSKTGPLVLFPISPSTWQIPTRASAARALENESVANVVPLQRSLTDHTVQAMDVATAPFESATVSDSKSRRREQVNNRSLRFLGSRKRAVIATVAGAAAAMMGCLLVAVQTANGFILMTGGGLLLIGTCVSYIVIRFMETTKRLNAENAALQMQLDIAKRELAGLKPGPSADVGTANMDLGAGQAKH